MYVYVADIWRCIPTKSGYCRVLKYGITNNPNRRLLDYNVGQAYRPYFINIYEIEITEKYKQLEMYSDIDFIFSHTARNPIDINLLEHKIRTSLPILQTLKNYLVQPNIVSNNGVFNTRNELIHENGLHVLNNIILNEFEKLGLHLIKKYTNDEVTKVNITMKNTYKQQELQYISHTHEKQSQSRTYLRTEYKKLVKIKPNELQRSCKQLIQTYYCTNNIGTVILPCGVGKTILSLFVTYWLNCYSICIGFPSTQNREDVKCDLSKMYGVDILSNVLCIDSTYNGTIDDIYTWIKSHEYDVKFVLVTYKSSYKLKEMTEKHNYSFNLCIGDEAHHLVSQITEDKKRKYQAFISIKSRNKYYMTATKKITIDDKKDVYSMDDETTFGHIICEKSFVWAIDNHKITDYNVLIVENSSYDIHSTDHLEMVSYTTFNVLHSQQFDIDHILLYANTIKKCEEMYEKLVSDLTRYDMNRDDIYMCVFTSKDNDVQHKCKLDKFIKSNIAIAITVYKMGEGFDCPKLDAVLPIEHMESLIRIVQSTLRPNRLNVDKQHKIAYYIFPFLTENDLGLDSSVRMINVLQQLDETVVDKIRLLRNKRSKRLSSIKSTLGGLIECNSRELETVKMKLIERKALMMKNGNKEIVTPEEYYLECVRNENEKLELTTSKQYNDSKSKRDFYVDEPSLYCMKNGLTWNGWHWFLKLDTQYFIKDIETWRKELKELGIDTIEKYERLCEEDARFGYDDLNVLYPEFTSLYSEFETTRVDFIRR